MGKGCHKKCYLGEGTLAQHIAQAERCMTENDAINRRKRKTPLVVLKHEAVGDKRIPVYGFPEQLVDYDH